MRLRWAVKSQHRKALPFGTEAAWILCGDWACPWRSWVRHVLWGSSLLWTLGLVQSHSPPWIHNLLRNKGKNKGGLEGSHVWSRNKPLLPVTVSKSGNFQAYFPQAWCSHLGPPSISWMRLVVSMSEDCLVPTMRNLSSLSATAVMSPCFGLWPRCHYLEMHAFKIPNYKAP